MSCPRGRCGRRAHHPQAAVLDGHCGRRHPRVAHQPRQALREVGLTGLQIQQFPRQLQLALAATTGEGREGRGGKGGRTAGGQMEVAWRGVVLWAPQPASSGACIACPASASALAARQVARWVTMRQAPLPFTCRAPLLALLASNRTQKNRQMKGQQACMAEPALRPLTRASSPGASPGESPPWPRQSAGPDPPPEQQTGMQAGRQQD